MERERLTIARPLASGCSTRISNVFCNVDIWGFNILHGIVFVMRSGSRSRWQVYSQSQLHFYCRMALAPDSGSAPHSIGINEALLSLPSVNPIGMRTLETPVKLAL